MKHQLPDLPYPLDALEPHRSRESSCTEYRNAEVGYFDGFRSLVNWPLMAGGFARGVPFGL